MQQTEQHTEQGVKQPVWETPELVKSDVSTATQLNVAAGGDGVAGS